MFKLYLEHVEQFFRAGHGPDEHVWAVVYLGKYGSKLETNRAATLAARQRGYNVNYPDR